MSAETMIDWDKPLVDTDDKPVQTGLIGDRRIVISYGKPWFVDAKGFLLMSERDTEQWDCHRVRNVPPAPATLPSGEAFTPNGAPHPIAPGTITTDGRGVYRWLARSKCQQWQDGGWGRSAQLWGKGEHVATPSEIASTTIPASDVPEGLRAEVARLRGERAAESLADLAKREDAKIQSHFAANGRDEEGHRPTPHEPVKGVTRWYSCSGFGSEGDRSPAIKVDGEFVTTFEDRHDIGLCTMPYSREGPCDNDPPEGWRAFRDRIRAERAAKELAAVATSNAETPQFKHDCAECTFLGRHDRDGKSFDLYHCTKQSGLPTLIARWGDDGPDYTSGLRFGWQSDDRSIPLVEARFRAEAAGLDVQREAFRPQAAAAIERADKLHSLETWPIEATRLRGPLWSRGEYSVIQYVGPEGVVIRVGIGKGSISLITWSEMEALGFLWSADGREWHRCVLA